MYHNNQEKGLDRKKTVVSIFSEYTDKLGSDRQDWKNVENVHESGWKILKTFTN